MASIVHERALSGEGFVQAIQHAVEGFGKVIQLIAASGERDALPELLGTDLARGPCHLAHGGQDPAGDEPPDDRGHHEGGDGEQ